MTPTPFPYLHPLPMAKSANGKRPLPAHGKAGFTLIEMIVVVALISIMLIVAIPHLTGGVFSDGTGETSRWIIANVRLLKEKATTDRQTYVLHVSPDTQKLWISGSEMSDDEIDTARGSGYALPQEISIDHVAFSETQRFSSGTIPIGFYPQGYSDKAVIRMKTNDGERLSFFIEPFLSHVILVRGSEGW